jgi:hypothetical protein
MKSKNKFNDRSYIISIVPVRNRITIPMTLPVDDDIEVSLPPIRFENITLQAAVYEHKTSFLKQILCKPVLVVNVDDPGEQICGEEFSEFMRELIENERMDDLLAESGSDEIYKRYGFESVSKNIWSLFHLSKIKNSFVFRTAND